MPDLAAALTAATPAIDGIILTDTQSPQASFDSLSSLARASGLPRNAVVAPSLLAHLAGHRGRLVDEQVP